MIEKFLIPFSARFARAILLPALFTLLGFSLGAQQPASSSSLADIVFLDSVVVRAAKNDFSIEDFIDLVMNDESFYQAFRNLRHVGYTFSTEMIFRDRQKAISGSLDAVHQQVQEDSCWRMLTVAESWSGDIRKKRQERYRYYTAEMYDRVFLYEGLHCPDKLQGINKTNTKGMEGHIEELKKLIFSPGSPSEVPFIGKKTAIFSDEMRVHYDFYIRSAEFQNKVEAYVFEARLKPAYIDRRDNHVVIKELTTYFSKEDFQVLGRYYSLAHYTLIYDFDVRMEIELTRIGDDYLPREIVYEGFWNVPFHRKEDGRFELIFSKYTR